MKYRKLIIHRKNQRNISHIFYVFNYDFGVSKVSKFQSSKISYFTSKYEFTSKIWDMGYIVLLLSNQIRYIFCVNDNVLYLHNN